MKMRCMYENAKYAACLEKRSLLKKLKIKILLVSNQHEEQNLHQSIDPQGLPDVSKVPGQPLSG